jgi:PleD family two-component response regulator
LLLRAHDGAMNSNSSPSARVLLVSARGHLLTRLLDQEGYVVVHARTGAEAFKAARGLGADIIIVDSELLDVAWADVCEVLQVDLRLSHSVPILVVTPTSPTPEQRVAGLRVGVWDFVVDPPDPADLALKIDTYAQAKRNVDLALAEGLVDPVTGLHSGPALARRARELGAVMARQHAGLACIVFALQGPPYPEAGSLLAQAVRASDLVGVLSRSELAVVAPGTREGGAVRLAQRVAPVLRERVRSGEGGSVAAALALRVGYDAVANLRYSPTDPIELLARASTAVRAGAPEAAAPWLRRFDPASVLVPEGSRERAGTPGAINV